MSESGADTIVGTLTRPDGLERVLIVKRADHLATYRRQSSNRESGKWNEPGPDCGLYDTLEAAEDEARERIWWLSA